MLVVVLAQGRTIYGQGNGQGNGQSEVQRGFDIAPVQLDLTGKNRSLVGQGSYYANGISACAGCHIGPAGHMGGGRNFGGVLSRNLTPDASGLPAGLTFGQFEQAIRLGMDFKGLPPPGPLVVMPWQELGHGTDRYLEAIYEYLKAIPCLEGGPGNTAPRC
jgi:hypothetical protein